MNDALYRQRRAAQFAEPGTRDAAGRLRVSQPFGLFESKHLTSKDAGSWDELLVGTASITYQYDRSSVFLTVGTDPGDRAVRQTFRYLPYVAGKGQLIQVTELFGSLKANVNRYAGYGDDLNGFFFATIGLQFGIVYRTATSGTAVDKFIPSSQWNVDTFDGNGESGLSVDLTKLQLCSIDFLWQGVGATRFFLRIGTADYLVHIEDHANVIDVAYIKTPSLPVRYEIVNTGVTESSTTLEQICSSVSSEGGYALPGLEFSAPPISAAADRAITTLTPILAIRLKTAFPAGKPNRRTIRFLDISVNSRTNEAWFELAHVHAPATMTATWADAHASSAVEYSVDISALTADMIHPIQEEYAQVGAGQAGSGGTISSEFLNAHSFLSQNMASDNSQIFVVYAKPRTGTANVWAHISWVESE